MFSPHDSVPLPFEVEVELVKKMASCTHYELQVVKAILQYMSTYKKSLYLELRRDVKGARKCQAPLYAMPEDLDTKKHPWLQALEELMHFAEVNHLPIDDFILYEPRLEDKAIEKAIRPSLFEKEVVKNLYKLERIIEGLENRHPSNDFLKESYLEVINTIKKLKTVGGEILDLRKRMIALGGNDFFELFDF